MKLPKTPQRTTLGFAFSMLDRAIREGVAQRQFRKAETEQIVQFFGGEIPECVYCGGHNVSRWDHLVAIRNGGSTVLGNMVLACGPCDDSKGANRFDEWMRATPRLSQLSDIEGRIARLKAYADNFGYRPHTFEEILSLEESAELAEIRRKLDDIRAEMHSFLYRYQNKV
jgi:hypothetical protein